MTKTRDLADLGGGFIQAGGGVQRSVESKLKDVVSVLDFIPEGEHAAIKAGTSTYDATAAIQAAIAEAKARNGATVYFPPGTFVITQTLVLDASNIILEGANEGYKQNSGNQAVSAATRLRWGTLADYNIPMIKVYTPAGSTYIHSGCGVKRMQLEGLALGQTGIHIISQTFGVYEHLRLLEFKSYGIKMEVVDYLITNGRRDNQRNAFKHVQVTSGSTTDGYFKAFYLNGDNAAPPVGDPNGSNVCFNIFEECDVYYNAGVAFWLGNSDRNVFTNCRANFTGTPPGGAPTRRSLEFHGNNDALQWRARSNVFLGFSVGGGSGAIYSYGTPTYTYPAGPNAVLLSDQTNSTPEPTIETGSSCAWSGDDNIQKQAILLNTVLADSSTTGEAARQLPIDTDTGVSLWLMNANPKHMRFITTDGSGNVNGNQYAININKNANTDLHTLRFVRDFDATGSRVLITLGGTSDRVLMGGHTTPDVTNTLTLGDSTYKWASVWASNGTIQTSDLRYKTEISPTQLGLDFINSLNPVQYKWIEGGNVVTECNDEGEPVKVEPIPGKRVHHGLLAQEVKAALPDGVDFGGWVLTDISDPDSQQSLRYDQFIAPLIKAVQELSAEVENLKAGAN